jgi:hypothetical protein
VILAAAVHIKTKTKEDYKQIKPTIVITPTIPPFTTSTLLMKPLLKDANTLPLR